MSVISVKLITHANLKEKKSQIDIFCMKSVNPPRNEIFHLKGLSSTINSNLHSQAV